MNNDLQQAVLDATHSNAVTERQVIQTLWSGYGEIVRFTLQGGMVESAIVKAIVIPDEVAHPRGWNTDRSHARKIRSYEVEMQWYQYWSEHCGDGCRVARCYSTGSKDNEHVIVLEDLDASGFSLRKSELNKQETKQCLRWLASFHATFMGEVASALWAKGSYWHLETRPDEWAVMEEGGLKRAASQIDSLLNNARHQTMIHGDAKVANFCFADDGSSVAAVDFQYVGGGCGMKDVAYFLGSCLNETLCEQWQDELLDEYFLALRGALSTKGKAINLDVLEDEWRALFPLAWVDFYRFLLGWMPDHWKVNDYSHRMATQVLAQLD